MLAQITPKILHFAQNTTGIDPQQHFLKIHETIIDLHLHFFRIHVTVSDLHNHFSRNIKIPHKFFNLKKINCVKWII